MIYTFAFDADTGIIELRAKNPTVDLINATSRQRERHEWWIKLCKRPRVNRVTTALLRVNHQIHHEALASLYCSRCTVAAAPGQLQTLSEFSQMPAALAMC